MKQGDAKGRLTHWLIRRAARGAPLSVSERLEEEWHADLATRPTTLSRLRFALGCCWATRVIAHEHRASGLALAPHVPGAKVAIPHLLEILPEPHPKSVPPLLPPPRL